MKESHITAGCLALLLCGMGGCARSWCCPAPCEPTLAAPAPVVRASEPPGGTPHSVREGQVLLQAAVLRVSEQAAERLVPSRDGIPSGEPRVVSAAEGVELQRRLKDEPGLVVLNMPSVVTALGQEATVWMGETYAMEGDSGPSTGFDIDRPNWSGQRLRAVATPSGDGSGLTLDFSFAMRAAVREGEKPDFAALAASDTRVHATVKLKPDERLVWLAPAKPGSASGRVLVVVDVKFIEPTIEAGKP